MSHEIHFGDRLDADLSLEGDVVVIGSGAGGGTAADVLSAAGLRVLLLEEGGYAVSKDFTLREVPTFARLYLDGAASPSADGALTVMQGRTVGGSTTVNWTSCFRTPEPTLYHWREAHGLEGFEPESLAPWFERMETRLHVTTQTVHNVNNQLFARGADRLGWRRGEIRRNVRGCGNLGYCGLGCALDAKQSMLITTIPDALDRGAALVTRVRARRLRITGRRVDAVEGIALDARGVRPTGRRVTLRAPFVVVAGGALGSPALLLRSEVPDPYERVGKRTFLQMHNYSMAQMNERVDGFTGAPQSIYSDQFTWIDGPTGKAGFNMEVAGAQPVASMNFRKDAGAAMAEAARGFSRLHVLVSQIRDGFHPESTGGEVRLRADGSAQLHYPLNPYLLDGIRRSWLAMAECQFAAGALTVHPASSDAPSFSSWSAARSAIATLPLRSPNVFLNSTHPLGGCAMGIDERTSVVRPDGMHHQIENLAVLDGSVLPTSLGVNPSLTIYALAARNASRLASQITGRAADGRDASGITARDGSRVRIAARSRSRSRASDSFRDSRSIARRAEASASP